MAERKLKKIQLAEAGNSGTQIYDGVIFGEEYNPTLTATRGMVEYDKMRRNDSTVDMALWSVKYPIIGADWFLTAGGDSEQDKEIHQKVQFNLTKMLRLRHAIEEFLTSVEFGFCVNEMVFSPMDIDGTLMIGLEKLAYRKQTSILKWLTDDKQPGITQYTIDGPKSIPEAKIARLTIRQEGDNYEGRSMLRTAYKHWFYKEKFYKMEAIGYERQTVGVPYAKYPKGATPEDRALVEVLLKNMRANQNSYLMTPIDWEAGWLDMKANTTKDTTPGISHHDVQILKGLFAQFMALGSTHSGSRAVSTDQSEFFLLGVNALADMIAELFNETIIKTMVDLNYTTDTYPRLEHGQIGDSNLEVISKAISDFVGAKLITPRPEDENVARKLVGLPELTEDEVKDRKKEADTAKANMVTQDTAAAADVGQPGASSKKKANEGDTEGELNAAVIEEARHLRASLDKVLYDSNSRQAA